MAFRNFKEIKEAIWYGKVPKEWDYIKVSYLARIGRGRVIGKSEMSEDSKYPVYSSQTKNKGLIGFIDSYDFNGDYVTWTTDGANAGTVFRRSGKFNCTNVCGTLNPNSKVDTAFLAYTLSLETKRYVRLDINPKLMNNEMAQIKVLVPPKVVQQKIADFLDQKTSEIDELIADKERLIELLEEKRQAIITEAVTKGLDPDVEIKDPGVDWIGCIPKGWNVIKLKYVCNLRDEKISGDNELVYVGLENIESKKGLLKLEGDTNIEGTSNLFYTGDVLFGKLRPYLAKCVLVDFDGKCTSELLVLAANRRKINSNFMKYLLLSNSFIDLVNSSTFGAKMPRANWEFISNCYLPIPDLGEQEKIVEFIDENMSHIKEIENELTEQITKLKEYRQSLIYEAVTGKIDVRDYPLEGKEEAYVD